MLFNKALLSVDALNVLNSLPKELTIQQQKNIDNFYKMTGIERKE